MIRFTRAVEVVVLKRAGGAGAVKKRLGIGSKKSIGNSYNTSALHPV